MKKQYDKPELIEYGDATKITKNGNKPNADTPQGCNNAYDCGSHCG